MTIPGFTTVTYAQHGGVDVELDFKVPSGASTERPAPILLWFHGGGLLQGSRQTIWPHLVQAPERHGLCVVSADYRLAPQTRLPGIMADIKAALDYLRSPKFLSDTGNAVDQSKIVVSGGSAGGWLALLLGSGVGFSACGLAPPERPLGVAAIYPITDICQPFWTTKQHPVSYYPRVIDESELAEYLDPSAPQTSSSPSDSPRSKMYHYMLQEALEQNLLLDGTGIPPEAFAIAPAVASGKATLPPTFIVHGTADDKVPISQSEAVAEACKARGIPVQFDVIPGADHLFDMDASCTLDAMYAFIADLIKGMPRPPTSAL